MEELTISKGLKYFLQRLETASEQAALNAQKNNFIDKEVPFYQVEKFSRAIMTQNIFIRTIGINGKVESTILSKAMFSISKVVRLYYSTSLDLSNQGYLRLRPDMQQQLIIIERLHGLNAKPELLYANLDEMNIIRFFANWILKRIDWDKTKINHLELYNNMKEIEKIEHEEKIAQELAKMEDLHLT